MLSVTLKALANFSPGQRPGIPIQIVFKRTLKVFATEPFQGSTSRAW